MKENKKNLYFSCLQSRFDAELSAAQEEIKKERLLREKLAREKDHAVHEKYSLEQDLQV